MKPTKIIRFILQFAVLGLAIAFIVVIFNPSLLQPRETQPVMRPYSDSNVSYNENRPPYSFASAVENAAPSVVSIYTMKQTVERPVHPALRGLAPENRGQKANPIRRLGSGVIINQNGTIVTNNHVIAGADVILVMLYDGRTTRAKVIGTDPESDLAVLQITLDKLPPIVFGDSERLQVGDIVLAIGNPYGVGQTVTQGIVSATGRKNIGFSIYENFIQTDAAINPGNSGGALVNHKGELVGISTAIFSKSGGSQGIGFVIPINLAKKIVQSIVTHGQVIRGWLGIVPYPRPITPQLAKELGLAPTTSGVLIYDFDQNSPAQQAGMQSGDFITAIGKQQITDMWQVIDLVADQKPGTVVIIHCLRAGKPLALNVTVGTRPPRGQLTEP